MSQARGRALLALDTNDCDGASSTTEKPYRAGGATTRGRVQGGGGRGKAERRLTEWHTAAGGGLGAAGATNSMELAGGGLRKRKKRAAAVLPGVVLGGGEVAVRAGEGDHGDGGLGSSRGRRSGVGEGAKWG